MQIAIVDDRAEDRAELSACLENYMKKHQLDYTLTEFEDGENFLKAAAEVNFQLVFMDIYMENMDGMEAARRLRQKNRICKIVFLTITEDYARMGYSLSASYYLLKPLSIHQADFEEAMELCQLKPPYEVMTLSVMADRQKLELPTEKILYIDYRPPPAITSNGGPDARLRFEQAESKRRKIGSFPSLFEMYMQGSNQLLTAGGTGTLPVLIRSHRGDQHYAA